MFWPFLEARSDCYGIWWSPFSQSSGGPVKRKAPKGNDIQDSELRPALAIHAFSGLVDESNYMPLEDDLAKDQLSCFLLR